MINNKIALHIYAPVLSLSGYGTASRQIIDYCLSDERFIVFLENVPWGNCGFIHENILAEKGKLQQYYHAIARYEQAQQQKIQFDLSIYCTIPNEFKRRAQVCIGATAGIEVDRITSNWINSCNMMDFIVVPSSFSRDILLGTAYQATNNETKQVTQMKIEKPVVVIPHWFNKPENIKIPNLNLSTKNNFLFVGMWGNKGGIGEDRKDIGTLIKTFYETFFDNADVGLVLKTEMIVNSTEDFKHTQKRLVEIKKNYPNAKCKVYLLHQLMTEEEMWGLYSHPDISAFVSFGCEGFGLGHLEALACNKPVIALNWSGHLDFCRKGKGFIPVDFDMKDVPECQVWENVIDKGSRWARIDVEDAKKRLKKFISSPKPIQQQVSDYQNELKETFSKENVALQWKEFFDAFLMPQNEKEREKVQHLAYKSRKQTDIDNLKLKHNIVDSEKQKVLYVMPMSMGDIVISTCIVDSLVINRHYDDEVYFATKKEYFEVLEGLVKKHNIKVIEYDDILINSEITREIWDTVYTPGVNVQYNFSNWTLGNGKYALNLLQEFAKQCNLIPSELTTYVLSPKEYKLPSKKYICLTAVSSKDAKKYKYWSDVVANVKGMLDEQIEVVQLGMKNEDKIPGTLDYRGISFNETFFVIQNALMHIGPDTGTGHAASAVGTPHLVLFASTSPNQCAPFLTNFKALQVCIDKACTCSGKSRSYKDVCIKDENGINCLSKIEPEQVCNEIYNLFKGIIEIETDEKLRKYLEDQSYQSYSSNQEIFDEAVQKLKQKSNKNEQEIQEAI